MRGDRAIRVYLAVAMLLVGAPAWEHAHAGGDRPHSHRHDDDHEGESHAHVHVALFGFELTLPAEHEESDSEEGRPASFIASGFVATRTTVELEQSFAHCADFAGPMSGLGELVPEAPPPGGNVAIAAPLCDTARHERSGVQLI